MPSMTSVMKPMSKPLSSLENVPKSGRRERGVSAVQQVYEGIRQDIINLTLPPGATIDKNKVAAEFGVSPTPVREALLRLSDEGVVDIFPQSRTTVSPIDVQHAREVHFMRLSVEVEIVRVLAGTISADGLAELNAWIQRQVTELKTGSQAGFHHADSQFHKTMLRLAGVAGLTRMIDAQRGHYDRIRGLFLSNQKRREVVVREHRAIIAALDAGDAAAAEAAVRGHLGKLLAIIDDIRTLHPNYFP